LKTPTWFSAQLAEAGTRVRRGEVSDDRAVTALSRSVLASKPLMGVLAADFARRELNRWLRRRGQPGEQGALFPALPAELDVAPGAFRSQESMTRHDWMMHLKIAENRRENAIEGAKAHFASVLAAYDEVMPLLTTDTMTTAEALRRGRAA
jgi:hypothetical protein